MILFVTLLSIQFSAVVSIANLSYSQQSPLLGQYLHDASYSTGKTTGNFYLIASIYILTSQVNQIKHPNKVVI